MNKSRFFLFVLCFLSFNQVAAQLYQNNSSGIKLNAYGTYASLDSYSGAQIPDAFTLQIQIGYNIYLQPGWKLEYRLLNPIKQNGSEGLTFPSEKVFLQVQDVQSNQSPITPSQLGYQLGHIPMSQSFVRLIENSPYGKSNIQYTGIETSFFLIIEGGSYLQEYKSYNQYKIELEYRLLDHNNNVVSTSGSTSIEMMIYPKDTPPDEVINGILVKGNARNATLDFNSLERYQDGVEVTYWDAVEVTTNTDYFILARATTDKLYSVNNNSLSLSNINIQLTSQNESQQGTIVLSNTDQVLIQAPFGNTHVQNFDLKYFTLPDNQEFIEAVSDTYTTTIIYSFAPQ